MSDDEDQLSLPLQGVCFCCTALDADSQSRIVTQATKMGGKYMADLTVNVTHLIAARTATPKYVFSARNRLDLSIMRVDWIPDLYEAWLQGDDIEITEWVQKYILPSLYQARICVTNLDREEKARIEELCLSNGAHFSHTLSKETTYLIAPLLSGNKVDFAKKNEIPIVHPSWLHQSIKRNATLDPKFFSLELPSHKIGQGAIQQSQKGKSERRKGTQNGTSTDDSVVVTKRRKLNSSKGENTELWNNILGLQPMSHTDNSPIALDGVAANDAEKSITEERTNGIFDNCDFVIHQFEEKKVGVIRDFLSSNGGRCLDSVSDLVEGSRAAFVLVSHNIAQSACPRVPTNTTVATDWWLERCLHYQRFEHPNEYVLSRPFRKVQGPMDGFQKFGISTTGFSGIEHLHVSKVIQELGATFYDTLEKGRSVLLVGPNKSALGERKIKKAIDWKTRVCKVDWIWTMLEKGKLVHLAPFSVDDKHKQGILVDKKFQHHYSAPIPQLSPEIPDSASTALSPLSPSSKQNDQFNDCLKPCRIRILGKTDADGSQATSAIKQTVEGLGGIVIDSTRNDPTHIVVPDSVGYSAIPFLENSNIAKVTEKWVFACQINKRRMPESIYTIDPLKEIGSNTRPVAACDSNNENHNPQIDKDHAARKPPRHKFRGRAKATSEVMDRSLSAASHFESPFSVNSEVDDDLPTSQVIYHDPEVSRQKALLLEQMNREVPVQKRADGERQAQSERSD